MRVVIVEPNAEARIADIPCGLASMQSAVDGCIEAVYPFEEDVALICNEEGKLMGKPLNRALRDEDGDIYEIVAGTFLIVGLTTENFGSLTPAQAEKYRKLFQRPESFIRSGDKIIVIPD